MKTIKLSYPVAGVLFCAIVLVAPLARASSGACSLKIVDIQEPSSLDYSPYSATGISETLTVTISNDTNQICSGVLIAQTPAARMLTAATSSDKIQYRLLTDGSNDLGSNRSSPDALAISVPAMDSNYKAELDLDIDAGQDASSGTYEQNVEFQIFDAGGSLVDQKNVPLYAMVEPQVGISIAGSAGASYAQGSQNAVMNFGTLKTNDKKTVYLKVRSNDPYKMILTSENNGRLKNLDVAGQYIDYEARLSGQLLNFSSGQDEYSGRKKTNDKGASHPLDVRIGKTENKAAGSYKDIITIDVYPQ